MGIIYRKDVPTAETWDLSLIYKTEDEFKEAVEEAKTLAGRIEKEFKGKLSDAGHIAECLELYEKLFILLYLTSAYTQLAVSVDYYDTANQERDSAMTSLSADIESRMSFIESEISEADEAVILAAAEKTSRTSNYLKDLLREKPHRLSPDTEKALAALGPVFAAPYDIYNMSKLADMKFESFTVNGKEYPLGYSLFEGEYEYVGDTQLRRSAFKEFSSKLKQYENTTAACYNAYLIKEKTLSKLRGFDSIFDAELFRQKVSREMHDRQIDLITELLAPVMRKYAKLIGRVHGLDKMTFADLKLPLDSGYSPEVTIEQSHEYVRNALAVLGNDYMDMVDEAYKNRWIDFANNQGKSTGGFCASLYGRNSFILMTWNNRMSDVYTIAHELGHAGHFRLCGEAQSFFDTNVSTYIVEAPSTMNELLLTQYLLKTNTDKRFRRWVLSNLIGNTYYHNFVTHLREAWYQREVVKLIDSGSSVNAETLSNIFRKNLEVFWGDAVELTEGCELTWMRQPHYYMGLYPYTYSAGLTVATQSVLNIEKEGRPAGERWIKMLKAGSTLPPAELAGLAGIDISTDEPLRNTINYISGLVDEICRLTEEIG